MKSTDLIVRSALVSLMALGLTAVGTSALAAKDDQEKCAGIVKAGKNDCGTSYSSCAGTAKKDGDAETWIYVPKGTCERIAGGKVTTSPHAMPGGKKG